ncbi:MAG: hypothetical protein KF862_07190 [Chitinophagaceae bacterium]|nr:hypothetical protein [Chitinophagaceae bacterium]
MSRIYKSIANPVRFVNENRVKPAAYNDFNFEDLFFSEMNYEWDEPVDYEQKWQTTDAIRLQFLADFEGISLKLTNQYTGEEYATVMDQKQQDINNPGFRIYEAEISLVDIAPGKYRLRAFMGYGENVSTLLSEPLCIQQKHEGTVYIEYFNSHRKSDMIFEKGFRPARRIEMRFDSPEVGSKDAMWEDQPLNMTMIDSKQFRVFKAVFGNEHGIHPGELPFLNTIFGFDNVRINGKQFCKAEAGQEFEPTKIAGYPLCGYRYNLRESLNRSSDIIDTDTDISTERKVYILSTAHTNIFGDIENTGSNQILIKKYE